MVFKIILSQKQNQSDRSITIYETRHQNGTIAYNRYVTNVLRGGGIVINFASAEDVSFHSWTGVLCLSTTTRCFTRQQRSRRAAAADEIRQTRPTSRSTDLRPHAWWKKTSFYYVKGKKRKWIDLLV